MIDLNNLFKMTEHDLISVKSTLVSKAFTELMEAVQHSYYGYNDLKDLNYSEICHWCEFPDLQDGGIFEQCIDIAADSVLRILGYKPQHV